MATPQCNTAGNCENCGNTFQKVGKILTGDRWKAWQVPEQPHQFLGKKNGFVCRDCEILLRNKTVPSNKYARKRTLPPSSTVFPKRVYLGKNENEGLSSKDAVSRCTEYFRARYYRRGLEVLVNNSIAARRALIQVHATIVKKEVSLLMITYNLFV